MHDEHRISDLVYSILNAVYVEHRPSFETHAMQQGASLEQLAAAAITRAIVEDEALQGPASS